jgi:hypothetical protein
MATDRTIAAKIIKCFGGAPAKNNIPNKDTIKTKLAPKSGSVISKANSQTDNKHALLSLSSLDARHLDDGLNS